MEKFYENLKKYSTEIIHDKKNEIPPLTDEEIKSNNNQNFCYIYNKQFCDVDDSDDIDDGGDDDESDARKVLGDAVEPDIAVGNYDDSDNDNDDVFDARKFHGDVVEFDSDSESMMIVIMMYLLPEGFRVILQNLILKMMIMMMIKNSMV